jgi:MFS family permease
MALPAGGRVGLAGAAVVGVAFGMARYAYGPTLPGIRQDPELPEPVLGLVAGATFAGYLAGPVLAGPLAARRGSRAPTTAGGACGAARPVVGDRCLGAAEGTVTLQAGGGEGVLKVFEFRGGRVRPRGRRGRSG